MDSQIALKCKNRLRHYIDIHHDLPKVEELESILDELENAYKLESLSSNATTKTKKTSPYDRLTKDLPKSTKEKDVSLGFVKKSKDD